MTRQACAFDFFYFVNNHSMLSYLLHSPSINRVITRQSDCCIHDRMLMIISKYNIPKYNLREKLDIYMKCNKLTCWLTSSFRDFFTIWLQIGQTGTWTLRKKETKLTETKKVCKKKKLRSFTTFFQPINTLIQYFLIFFQL